MSEPASRRAVAKRVPALMHFPASFSRDTSIRAASILWKNLRRSGHDACDLWQLKDGWGLAGTAMFREEDAIVRLHYDVGCDRDWRTRHSRVRGMWGSREMEIHLTRTEEGEWKRGGKRAPEVAGCLDVDLSFTPATNLIALRRLALAVGAQAEVPAAWLELPETTLRPLAQTYRRESVPCYDYTSPTTGYSGLLQVHETGFVLEYPGLWTAEALHVFQK